MKIEAKKIKVELNSKYIVTKKKCYFCYF